MSIQSPHGELRRELGAISAVMITVGSVIGSGIFLTTGVMADAVPSTSLLLFAWAVGGALVIAGGLTYSEMAAMYPRSGGVYVFLREAYGTLPAFPPTGIARRPVNRGPDPKCRASTGNT